MEAAAQFLMNRVRAADGQIQGGAFRLANQLGGMGAMDLGAMDLNRMMVLRSQNFEIALALFRHSDDAVASVIKSMQKS
jgi:hypothetical protein